MMAARHFEIQRELVNTRENVVEKREEWLNSQHAVNRCRERLHREQEQCASGTNALTSIKIVHPANSQPIRCLALFRGLYGNHSLQSLSLIGQAYLDPLTTVALTQVLVSSSSLTRLQIAKVSFCLIPFLCQALSTPGLALRDMRLCFVGGNDDGAQYGMLIPQLLQAIQKSQLRSVHLFGLNLRLYQDSFLVSMAQEAAHLRDLVLVRCNLCHVRPLCQAVVQSRTLQTINLSLNPLENINDLSPLLQSLLAELSVSQCQLQGRGGEFCRALATNTKLRRLDLDVNPLTQSFGNQLLDVLRGPNTTLVRLSLMIVPPENPLGKESSDNDDKHVTRQLAAQLRHATAMNEAGRACAQGHEKVLPTLVARVLREPSLIYGLLQERPFSIP